MNEDSAKKAKKTYTVKDGKRFLDRSGIKYGKLTALSVTRYNARNQTFWKCLCGCGNQCEVFSGNLNSGHTTSCGCEKGLFKHGEAGKNRSLGRTKEYQAMASMLQRCFNPSSPMYPLYGGRGISVCAEWDSLHKFKDFLAHVGRAPTAHHTLDRWPDGNGNYEPGNVRWATVPEQNRNTSRNVWLTFCGETLCRRDMAEKYGISDMGLKKRIKKGMTVEDALVTPVNRKMWNKRRLLCES